MKAFPTHKEEGMELRDYFAAKAMQSLVQASTTLKYDNELSFDNAIICGVGDVISAEYYDENGKAHPISWARWYADEAYVIADAMMKARDGNTGE